jgi:FlaA1/EpsC-like NDP-sugar epimerase
MAPRPSNSLVAKALDLSRIRKRALVLLVDCALCIATVSVAYWVRLDYWHRPSGTQWLSYILALALSVPIFIRMGLYRAIFRYAGWGALVSVIKACAIYGVLYFLFFSVIGVKGIPRTVGVIQPALLFIAVGSTRWFARFLLGGGGSFSLVGHQRRRVLVFGAGAAGRQLAAALAFGHEMRVVGFVDDDRTLQGNILNGVTIYPAVNLDGLIRTLDVDDLLLAAPSSTRQRRREIVESIQDTDVVIRTLPSMMDLAQGRVTVNDLHELDIDELLGRDTVLPDHGLMAKTVAGKVILVSGAGGSIGSELCRQIMGLGPTTLLLLEQSEFNLYSIHRELEQSGLTVELVPILATVQDDARIESVFARWKPDTVYHAAAYKHVPLVEINPTEGLRNNVFGTRVLARAAARHGVTDFVLISTDKAVRPTNIMGASKRMAEQILQGMASRETDTCFSMVRFGNVLGSSGSVVPLFRQQIKAGGPVTVTHEDITRYFMTIPEAAQLVVQAAGMAKGGEVFVLDMGDAVRISDLARRMIELSGLSVRDEENPHGDIEIGVIGTRPGEKLYEELLIGNDARPTDHAKIMQASEHFLTTEMMDECLAALDMALERGDNEDILRWVRKIVPEYGPEAGEQAEARPSLVPAKAAG